jgi:DNA polymerase V
MTDLLVLELVAQGLETDKVTLTIGYDRESLTDPKIRATYTGPICSDYYGRQVPQHAHGTASLPRRCASTRLISDAMMALFDRIANPALLVRRINLAAVNVKPAGTPDPQIWQMDLFTDAEAQEQENMALAREQRRQQAVLHIRKKYGKNAILKGMNFMEGATTRDRNAQIGGHKA